MRLFFSICLLSFIPLDAVEYIPFALEREIQGIGFLREDIDGNKGKICVNFTEIKMRHQEAGAFFTEEVFLSNMMEPHYKGEIWVGSFLTENDKITVISIDFIGRYGKGLDRMRAVVLQALRERFHRLDSGGYLLESLILGKTGFVSQQKALFRQAGLSHVLALSGLHRGIIAVLLIFILKPIIPRRYLGILILIFLMAYSWLIGVRHSLLRALIMYGFLVCADFFRFKPHIMKILILSLLLQMILWPGSQNSLSLQLSYLAMVGIILVTPVVSLILIKRIPPLLALPLSVSVGAQLYLLPLLLSTFGQVQLWGIAAGLIITPIITVYIWLGIIIMPLLFIDNSALFGLIYRTFEALYRIIIELVSFFSHFPAINAIDGVGQVLFFISISVILLSVLLFIIKELPLDRKKTQLEL